MDACNLQEVRSRVWREIKLSMYVSGQEVIGCNCQDAELFCVKFLNVLSARCCNEVCVHMPEQCCGENGDPGSEWR